MDFAVRLGLLNRNELARNERESDRILNRKFQMLCLIRQVNRADEAGRQQLPLDRLAGGGRLRGSRRLLNHSWILFGHTPLDAGGRRSAATEPRRMRRSEKQIP